MNTVCCHSGVDEHNVLEEEVGHCKPLIVGSSYPVGVHYRSKVRGQKLADVPPFISTCSSLPPSLLSLLPPFHSQSPAWLIGHGSDCSGWHELETEVGLEPGRQGDQVHLALQGAGVAQASTALGGLMLDEDLSFGTLEERRMWLEIDHYQTRMMYSFTTSHTAVLS